MVALPVGDLQHSLRARRGPLRCGGGLRFKLLDHPQQLGLWLGSGRPHLFPARVEPLRDGVCGDNSRRHRCRALANTPVSTISTNTTISTISFVPSHVACMHVRWVWESSPFLLLPLGLLLRWLHVLREPERWQRLLCEHDGRARR